MAQKPFSDKALGEPSVLSDDDRAQIRARAREEVDKEYKDAALKAELDKALAEERKKRNSKDLAHEDTVIVMIDLPGYTDRMTINNRHYMQGRTYTVSTSVARDMQSIMARAWQHEDEIGGANRDQYRKPANRTLRPGMESI
jgi:predicted glycoside hydrolase/deacetylase ChbG (UPF0249 family)